MRCDELLYAFLASAWVLSQIVKPQNFSKHVPMSWACQVTHAPEETSQALSAVFETRPFATH